MKKTLLLLLAKFVAVTAPLTWLWMHGGQEAYFKFFVALSRPFLILLGVTNFPPSLVRDRFLNLVPFLALMLITPGLSVVTRLSRTALGFVLIFLSQIGLTYWAYVTHIRDGKTAESMANYFPALVMSDALPFVLWALLANRFLRELLAHVLPQTQEGTGDAAGRVESPRNSAES